MGDHTELSIDTEHARHLAMDLAHSGQALPFLPPTLIESPGTRRFLAAAGAALQANTARGDLARQQARELAESSFSSVSEIADTDTGFAGRLERT
ncbi:hypothetical protein [Corynebacterium sp. A21]|uniref:hypothetical protein n=1 Tax=Corynebacterium sp. A21 TaxID=3457318 RepID=UPI003FD257D0